MADAIAITLATDGTVSGSGAGAAVDIGALRSCVKATLAATTIVAGTSLTVAIETSTSATGPWAKVGAFVTLTVTKAIDGVFADCRRYVRATWALTGAAPSATFAVAGEAHVLYASLRDIDVHGISKQAIGTVSVEERAEHALAATGEAEGYLAGGYKLPLVAWSTELRRQVAQLAVYAIMSRRGFQPQGTDELIVKNRDDAISWLSKVNRGLIQPPGIVDSTPEIEESSVVVVSGATAGDFWP